MIDWEMEGGRVGRKEWDETGVTHPLPWSDLLDDE